MFTSHAKNCRNKTDQLTYLLAKTHTHTHKIHIPWIQNLGKVKIGCEICHTYAKYRIQEHI